MARKDESSGMPLDIEKESVFGGLLKILNGNDEKQILQVLRMVKTIRNERLLTSFKKLISHPSSIIQLEVLRNIYSYKHVDFSDQVKELIFDEDIDVKTEALHYLFQHETGDKIKMLQSYLDHSDFKVRGAALLCAAQESRNNQRLKDLLKIKDTIEQTLKHIQQIKDKEQIDFSKVICDKVIDAADIPDLYPYLHLLLNDSSQEVKKAAIENAGLTHQREYIPVLIRLLKTKDFRNSIQKSLACYGQELISVLPSYLSNPYVDKNIRMSIPRILFLIGIQRSVDVLIENLGIRDLSIRYEVISALYQSRLNYSYLKFRENIIVKQILGEAYDYVDMLAFLYSQAKTNSIPALQGPHQTNDAKDDRYLPFIVGLINSHDEQVRETAKVAIQNIWGYPFNP